MSQVYAIPAIPPGEEKLVWLVIWVMPQRTTRQTVASTVVCSGVKQPQPKPPTTESKGNRKLTEFFRVRRTARKTRSSIIEEKKKEIEEAIRSCKEDGLEITKFDDKGRGIIATKMFRRGDFVVEYSGELVSKEEAQRRELAYARDETVGCYMYYFTYQNKQYCVDATEETGRLGRLVNHSRNGNLATKAFTIENLPHLILVANRDIVEGEELSYDYGDRRKTAILNNPWLTT